jgi:hypothetical protein
MRIYIGSTIPSYVVARPARDLLQAARQQLTLPSLATPEEFMTDL